jgi:hypothetical protein
VTVRKKRQERDIEKKYPPKQFVAKLRRLADCIEKGKTLSSMSAETRRKKSSFSSSGRLTRGVAHNFVAQQTLDRTDVCASPEQIRCK